MESVFGLHLEIFGTQMSLTSIGILLYLNEGLRCTGGVEFDQPHRSLFNPTVDLKVTMKWKMTLWEIFANFPHCSLILYEDFSSFLTVFTNKEPFVYY